MPRDVLHGAAGLSRQRAINDAAQKQLDLSRLSPPVYLPFISLRARESRRFPEALELARQCEGVLPPARLAEVRATIWQAANEPQIAQMFFEGAARLQRRPLSLKTEA